MTQDEQHLNLLSIFHYVVGGLAGCFALFPVIHLVIGLILVFAPEKFGPRGQAPPPMMGWVFVGVAAVVITIGWIFAIVVLIAGRYLARRARYTFCMVVAGIECLFMPFGTVLGVFTIVVLMRESVRQLFAANSSPFSSPG